MKKITILADNQPAPTGVALQRLVRPSGLRLEIVKEKACANPNARLLCRHMKKLTSSEIKTLAALVSRAIEHNQLDVSVHSPFDTEAERKASGHPINDRWDGNTTNLSGGLVEVSANQSHDALESGKDDNDQPCVNIFVPQHAIDFLSGDVMRGEPDAEIA